MKRDKLKTIFGPPDDRVSTRAPGVMIPNEVFMDEVVKQPRKKPLYDFPDQPAASPTRKKPKRSTRV